MSNTFIIRNTQGAIVATISEKGEDKTSTSLVLHGRGNKHYGVERDDNLVHLLENFSSTDAPSNPINGQLWWNRSQREVFVFDTSGSPTWHSIIPPAADIGFNIVAGAGLTGGGNPSGSPLSVTLNVGAGTGISVAANTISTNDSAIVHDNLDGFVANEHINHASVSLIAGDGLTGGGTLTQSRTLHVGAGTGISVTANQVAVNSTVVRTSGNQTINGIKSFHEQLRGDAANTPSAPAWSFDGDTDTGFYRSGTNELSFATGGIRRVTIESNGTMNVSGTNNYENLVTEDDDIPNKRYVDSVAAAGGSVPTENFHAGTSIVTGLTVGKTYLVSGYGTVRNKGNGGATLYGARVGTGTTPGGGSTLAQTPSLVVNWMDGQGTQSATFVITATSTSMNFAPDWESSVSRGTSLKLVAIQLD